MMMMVTLGEKVDRKNMQSKNDAIQNLKEHQSQVVDETDKGNDKFNTSTREDDEEFEEEQICKKKVNDDDEANANDNLSDYANAHVNPNVNSSSGEINAVDNGNKDSTTVTNNPNSNVPDQENPVPVPQKPKPAHNFICKECNKGFSRSSRLKKHLETHARNKPHICGICQKCFISQFHLDQHISTHTHPAVQSGLPDQTYLMQNFLTQQQPLNVLDVPQGRQLVHPAQTAVLPHPYYGRQHAGILGTTGGGAGYVPMEMMNTLPLPFGASERGGTIVATSVQPFWQPPLTIESIGQSTVNANTLSPLQLPFTNTGQQQSTTPSFHTLSSPGHIFVQPQQHPLQQQHHQQQQQQPSYQHDHPQLHRHQQQQYPQQQHHQQQQPPPPPPPQRQPPQQRQPPPKSQSRSYFSETLALRAKQHRSVPPTLLQTPILSSQMQFNHSTNPIINTNNNNNVYNNWSNDNNNNDNNNDNNINDDNNNDTVISSNTANSNTTTNNNNTTTNNSNADSIGATVVRSNFSLRQHSEHVQEQPPQQHTQHHMQNQQQHQQHQQQSQSHRFTNGALSITAQPAPYGRFRYRKEGRRTPIQGRGEGVFPTVAVAQEWVDRASGPIIIVPSLVTRNTDVDGEPIHHYHSLECIQENTPLKRPIMHGVAVFHNLVVNRVPFKHAAGLGSPGSTRDDQMVIRILFSTQFQCKDGSQVEARVISEPIFGSDLRIEHVSHSWVAVEEATSITLLTRKVAKKRMAIQISDSIQTHMLNANAVAAGWFLEQGYPTVLIEDVNVHMQYACVVTVPPYWDQTITTANAVKIQLVDLLANAGSEPQTFEYRPTVYRVQYAAKPFGYQ